jgi:hypothetical protein
MLKEASLQSRCGAGFGFTAASARFSIASAAYQCHLLNQFHMGSRLMNF